MTTAGVATSKLLGNESRLSRNETMKTMRTTYRGEELRTIGMPIGGICAGQVNLGGDGRLWLWDVFNQIKSGIVARSVVYRDQTLNSCGGSNYVEPPDQVHPFGQGFGIAVGGKPRAFAAGSWKDIEFTGEYPIGYVRYADPECAVTVDLEAFSPFCPLDEDNSGLPATTLHYTVRNVSNTEQDVVFGGWMENPIGMYLVKDYAVRQNTGENGTAYFNLVPTLPEASQREPKVFEDWARNDFGPWEVTGDAFGPGPIGGNVPCVKSYRPRHGETNLEADARLGKLTSPEFVLDRNLIVFTISGGNHPKTVYVGLIVNGALVRSATGLQSEEVRTEQFDVSEFAGQRGHLVIVDDESGLYGQLTVGKITFTDQNLVNPAESTDVGSMALGFLEYEDGDVTYHGIGKEPLHALVASRHIGDSIQVPINGRPISGIRRHFKLAAGESKTVSVAVAWCFPKLTLPRIGDKQNFYSVRHNTAKSVLAYLRENHQHLSAVTRNWHDTWYDSNLPRWFLDRTMGNTSVLASMTCLRFGEGRFYAWEGVGSCEGTCGHVWQYAQSVGRLFPGLERSVREQCDYKDGVGFNASTGLIDFRGEYGFGYAADSQAGYILRTYREHQTSADDAFLKRVYAPMKKALEHLISHDPERKGVFEGRQHNTLDVDLIGPSSWLTSLYLAALRAGEEMAKEMGDSELAASVREVFDRGASAFVPTFWNGEYFVQKLDLQNNIDLIRIGDGCEVDQLMGQWWAHQVGLGRIVDQGKCQTALKALFKHNFVKDVGPYRDQYTAGRWFAMPGEPGMIMCTFPKGDRDAILGPKPTWASMYFNEVWTGTEYQVAGHMMSEGLVEEAMAVCEAVHERHHASRRNPWNEIECGDHYARCLAIYGVYVAACGFTYHGPKQAIGFAPKMHAEDFRAAFTAAEGWGTFQQRSGESRFEAELALKHGQLALKTLALEVPFEVRSVTATVAGKPVASTWTNGSVVLGEGIRLRAGESLAVTLNG